MRKTVFTNRLDRYKPRAANEIICACAVCGKDLLQSEANDGLLSDNYIYKCGELQYIEIYHTACDGFDTDIVEEKFKLLESWANALKKMED